MTTETQLIENAQSRNIRSFFCERFDKQYNDIYFSKHFADRMIERRLVGDKFIIAQIVEYFYNTIYLHTSHTERTYLLKLRSLKIPIMIKTGAITGKRYCVVKSAFENDVEYLCDETIELQATIKN